MRKYSSIVSVMHNGGKTIFEGIFLLSQELSSSLLLIKIKKKLEGCLDLNPSPSPSVKIQMVDAKLTKVIKLFSQILVLEQ